MTVLREQEAVAKVMQTVSRADQQVMGELPRLQSKDEVGHWVVVDWGECDLMEP